MNPAVLQRTAALARAHEVRTARAALKRQLVAGTADVVEVLRDPPDYLNTATVGALLAWQHRWGTTRARRCCHAADVNPDRTMGRLVPGQLERVVAAVLEVRHGT